MKKSVLFIIAFILGCLSSQLFRHFLYNGSPKAEPIVTRDTLYDTIPYLMPVPYDSVVVRYVKVPLPVGPEIKDTIVHSGDSIQVVVPITQKEYKDSLYQAWVSGYSPKLDSIHIFQATATQTIYQPIVTKSNNRWGLGVQVGIGTNFKQISPFIGIGISYNILTW